MYEIFLKDRAVGHAEVKKEGLYYIFTCTCTPPEGDIYRVSVTDGRNRQDLGILVPEGEKFTLKKRIACKCLNADTLSFTLLSKERTLVSVPVVAGEMFEYLDKLETAHLQATDGQPEIVIDPAQDPQDSGLSQEPQSKSE